MLKIIFEKEEHGHERYLVTKKKGIL